MPWSSSSHHASQHTPPSTRYEKTSPRPPPYDPEATPRVNDASAYLRPGANNNALLRRRSTAYSTEDPFEGQETWNSPDRPRLSTAKSDRSISFEPSTLRPRLSRATSSGGRVPSLRSSEIRGVKDPAAPSSSKQQDPNTPKIGYKERVQLLRKQSREIFEHVERECSALWSASSLA